MFTLKPHTSSEPASTPPTSHVQQADECRWACIVLQSRGLSDSRSSSHSIASDFYNGTHSQPSVQLSGFDGCRLSSVILLSCGEPRETLLCIPIAVNSDATRSRCYANASQRIISLSICATPCSRHALANISLSMFNLPRFPSPRGQTRLEGRHGTINRPPRQSR